jgi:hypothetical protein
MRAAGIILIILMTGCDSRETIHHVVDTVSVNVPVIERASAPPELYRAKLETKYIPVWIAPNDPAASSCLSSANEPLLKNIVLRNESLLDAWEAYSK